MTSPINTCDKAAMLITVGSQIGAMMTTPQESRKESHDNFAKAATISGVAGILLGLKKTTEGVLNRETPKIHAGLVVILTSSIPFVIGWLSLNDHTCWPGQKRCVPGIKV
jgi:hypothetical protein